MRLIFIILACVIFTKITFADNLVQPSPEIDPIDVVEIQLFALQSNDENDFGIKQTWEFAHPRNKMATGPLPRFTNMIKTPAYSILLNNLKFETKEIFNDGTNAGIAVRIEAQDNKAYLEWQQNGLIIDQSLKAIKKAINEAGFTVEEVLSAVEGSTG